MAYSLVHGATCALLLVLCSFLAASSASEDPAVSPSIINCTRLPNGKYVRGCSANFTFCANGQAYPAQCPDKLAMNPTTGICQAPLDTAISVLAMGEMRRNFSLYKVNTVLDCSSAPYGFYPAGYCTRQFYHCALGGCLEELTCPAGFVFDDISRDEPICNQPAKCAHAMAIKRPWEALVVAEPAPEPVTIASPTTSPPRYGHSMRRSGQVGWPISNETDAGSNTQVLTTDTGVDSLYESRLREFVREPSDDNYDAAVGVLELAEKAFDVGSKKLAYVDKLIELRGKLEGRGYTGEGVREDLIDPGLLQDELSWSETWWFQMLSESGQSPQQSQQRTSLIRHSDLRPVIDDSTNDSPDKSVSSSNALNSSPAALASIFSDFARQPTNNNYDAAMGVLMLTERAYEMRTKELAYINMLSDVEEKLEKSGYIQKEVGLDFMAGSN